MAASACSWVHAPRGGTDGTSAAKLKAESQAKGVRNLLRQGHRLVAPRQPLVRIAQSTTASGRQSCGTPHQRRPHRGTQRHGAAGDRRARSPCVKCVCAEATAPRKNNVVPKARCAATSMAASWTCCARVRSCSPSACAVWYSART